MERTSITGALGEGRILVSDGAWGTFLFRKGLAKGDCPELWCVVHPDEVRDIAASYIAAGADMVETNSFGGTSIRLARHGLASRAGELNEAAARLSREAAGDSKWVIASMGPTGKFLSMGDVSAEEMYASYAEQAEAQLAREKTQLQAHYEDLNRRLQEEITHQKVLLAEHQQRLDEQYQKSKH